MTAKYLGKMVMGRCPICNSVVALAWLDGMPQKELGCLTAEWVSRDLLVNQVERYEGEPMPGYCWDRAEHIAKTEEMRRV